MDIQRAVKYLDIWSGRKATESESKYPKYFHIQKSRAIKKIPYIITLPAYTQTTTNVNPQTILFQYNVEAPSDFYIINFEDILLLGDFNGAYLTVKYRIGNAVYRYYLGGIKSYLSYLTTLAPANYTGELIKKNCVFEVFFAVYGAPVWAVYPGIGSDLEIKTNIFVNPDDPEELDRTFATPVRYNPAQLGFDPEETFPTQYTNQAFLDNI